MSRPFLFRMKIISYYHFYNLGVNLVMYPYSIKLSLAEIMRGASLILRPGGTTVNVGRLKAQNELKFARNSRKKSQLLKSGEVEVSPVSPLLPGLILTFSLPSIR